MIRPFPTQQSAWEAKDIEEQFAALERFVTMARAGRALLAYPPGARLRLFGAAKDPHQRMSLENLHTHLEQLSRASVHITDVHGQFTHERAAHHHHRFVGLHRQV